MRSHPRPGAWLGLSALVAGLAVAPAFAAVDSTATRPMILRSGAASWEDLCLGRAALEQSLGRTEGVVRDLEGIDFTNPPPDFAAADRAAFLLGQAYLRTGSASRFAALARAVAAWPRSTPYTQWLALELRLAESQGAVPRAAEAGVDSIEARRIGFGVADALAASLRLGDGDVDGARALLADAESGTPAAALAAYVELVARQRAGEDLEPALVRLAAADTTSALGRDLAGLAWLERATAAAGRGEDPRPLLDRVPAGSRYAVRARHMAALATLERGDVAGGGRALDALAVDSTYEDHRQVLLARAGGALDAKEWTLAHERYAAIDRDWTENRDALRAALASDHVDSLWAVWEADAGRWDVLLLDALPARAGGEALAHASARLDSMPVFTPPALLAPPPTPPSRWPVRPPSAGAWREVSSLRARAREAAAEVERADRETAAERARLADLRRYLGLGMERARGDHGALVAEVARLDSLEALLRGIDGRLQAARDEAGRRVAARAARIATIVEAQRAWIAAIRHLYVEGRNQARESWAPFGYPSPDSVTRSEQALAESLQVFVQRFAAGAADLLDRSYAHAWRPAVIERALTNRQEAHRLLDWSTRLGPAIAATLEATASSPELLALQATAARRAGERDSLEARCVARARDVAHQAVSEALAALEREREGIDYGLAVSAYGASVRLAGAADSTAVAAAARDSAHAGPDEEADDPEAARWRAAAIPALQTFLARHGDSPARGEMRFRLADLLLIDARQSFRARMADYLARQEAGTASGPPPLMDPAPALALYRAILKEDPGFERRDAVLFNAAMLLADQGDPEAGAFFERLVREHPGSEYAQESWLRMGDLAFDDKRFADCVPLYEHAAAGADPSLRAIALYKLGWAHFNGERLDAAADAFRAVLDVYESNHDLKRRVDLEGEAEAYLVHSLARAGGAEAFVRHFPEVGGRPYERKVLRDLGHHFLRYSMFGEAADAEELMLRRYPLDADALAGAQRLPETYERWDHADLARKARLELAPRFAPGSAWAAAQSSDSVKTAGAAFARSAWLAVALDHHRAARARGDREDWSEALRLYRTLLDHWPQDSLAASFQLVAGEASQHLGDPAGALRWYAQAASGPDSVARQALYQEVAVTDAWYESTRGKQSLGSDSLARAVLAAGDTMRTRFPDHPAGADVSWRSGNLAFAHGWNERAAEDFDRLIARAPGDPRAPTAAALRADAFFRMNDFARAGAAFEVAQKVAHEAGKDSLEKRATAAIPVCWFRAAEAFAASDSTAHGKQAEMFEQVATRWPSFEHAHLARYRAGLAWFEAGRTKEGVAAMQGLIRDFPKSEYVRDAHLQIAKAWETHDHPVEAADAYLAFARAFPRDSSAAGAWLKAADLLEGAGQAPRATELRVGYVKSHPEDVETGMEVYRRLALKDLSGVAPEHPVSALLDPDRPASRATARRGRAAAKAAMPDTTVARSSLAEYLRRAKAHPALLDKSVLAQVRYLQGEEARASYVAARLTQPLEKSIPIKQRLLDSTLARYRASVDLGAPEWADASTFRIGEALVAFGEALERSERPADLQGDDLRAYDAVILEQSQTFYARGEDVWSDLLRTRGKDSAPDAWVTQAREALWKRLGDRFVFKPEAEYPLVGGSPPEPDRDSAAADSGSKGPMRAQREEGRP